MTELEHDLASLTPEQRRLVEHWLRTSTELASPHLPPTSIPRRRATDPCPLTFAQQQLWFLQHLNPYGTAYTFPLSVRLQGPCDLTILRRCLQAIVQRHDVLRTTFVAVEGRPQQVIAPTLPMPLQRIDLSALPTTAQEPQAQHLMRIQAAQPFDLARGPLLRAGILRLSATTHILLITVHHIIFDDWSQGVFVRELITLYSALCAGRTSLLPDLPIQYGDYAAWQRQRADAERNDHLAFWTAQLHDAPSFLDIPTDYPRPPIRSEQGASYTFVLAPSLVERLTALSRRAGATLFMTLLAAFDVLLYRLSGQTDIVVGAPLAKRTQAELEGLIGLFADAVALRTQLNGKHSFLAVLQQARTVALAAYTHQEVAFEQVLAALALARDPSRHPLFQVLLALQNAPMPALNQVGLRVEPLEVSRPIAHYDLMLFFRPEGAALRGRAEYRTDLFERPTIARLVARLQLLLEGILADPEQLIDHVPLLRAAERHQLLVEWNTFAVAYPHDASVHQLFETQAARTPDVIALVSADQHLSYAALSARASQLAGYLRAQGVGSEVVVGLCMERSIDLLVGLLGILKAGGTYLPLDPAYPDQRRAFMLEDARASLLLTQQPLSALRPAHAVTTIYLDRDWPQIARAAALARPIVPHADQCAYVIYTSGSTGRAKGVMIAHRSLASIAHAWERDYALGREDCHLQMASFSFDVFAGDLARALCFGGKLLLAPRELMLDPPKLHELIYRQRVTCAEFVPATLRSLMSYLEQQNRRLDQFRLLVCGSDSWHVSEYRRFQQCCGPTTRLINSFGLTEATIDSAWYETPPPSEPGDQVVPIGRPFANTRLYILDKHLQPPPMGAPGELYIGGSGLARGYLGRPDLTAERFIPNPFIQKSEVRSQESEDEGRTTNDESADSSLVVRPSSRSYRLSAIGYRLYRTGDLARYRPDGAIAFLGRIDHQVKLRGVRIELDEIAATLLQHADVRDCAVVVRTDGLNDARLTTYVVTNDAFGGTSDASAPGDSDAALGAQRLPLAAELRSFLAERLPAYMAPSAFVFLAALPLTPNGKLDRRALPAPDQAIETAHYVAPRDTIEELLAGIWAEVLRRARVGIHDNFFELGGHSLLVVRLLTRVQQAMGVQLPLASIFQNATVAAQAALLRASPAPSDWQPLVPIQPHGRARPLFIVHGIGGTALDFQALSEALGPDQPLYGFQARGVEDDGAPFDTIAALASAYLTAICTLQPSGPYRLAGWSFGGLVAFELACQLVARGETVAQLVLLDSRTPQVLDQPAAPHSSVRAFATALGRQLGVRPAFRLALPAGEVAEQLEALLAQGQAAGMLDADVTLEQLQRRFGVFMAHQRAAAQYEPSVYTGPLTVLYADAAQDGYARIDPSLGWDAALGRAVGVIEVPGDHYTMLQAPQVRVLADHLRSEAEKDIVAG